MVPCYLPSRTRWGNQINKILWELLPFNSQTKQTYDQNSVSQSLKQFVASILSNWSKNSTDDLMQKNYNAIKKCFIVAFPEGVHALKECDFALSDADFANTGVFTHIFINKLSWHLFNLFSSFQPNINFYFKYMWKMSIQCTVLGLEPTTFRKWVHSHNHKTRSRSHKTFHFGVE